MPKDPITFSRASRLFRGVMTAKSGASSAFTLVELLTVIGVLGLLAALLLPAISRFAENSKSAACMGNLRQLGAAVFMYVGEHNGQFPDAGTSTDSNINATGLQWDYQLMPYLGVDLDAPGRNWRDVGKKSVFRCPGALVSPALPARSRSYSFNRRITRGVDPTDRRPSSLIRPSETLLIAEIEFPEGSNQSTVLGGGRNNAMDIHPPHLYFAYRHGGHTNILFADGHVGARLPFGGVNAARSDPQWRPNGVRFSNSLAPLTNPDL